MSLVFETSQQIPFPAANDTAVQQTVAGLDLVLRSTSDEFRLGFGAETVISKGCQSPFATSNSDCNPFARNKWKALVHSLGHQWRNDMT